MHKKRFTVPAFVLVVMLAPYLTARATEKILYRFTGGADGAVPSSGLLMDAAGNLYGTTAYGGNLSGCNGRGCGTVFKLTPLRNGKWKEQVLCAFQGGVDGYNPTGNLVFD